jgi:hypothetical protein
VLQKEALPSSENGNDPDITDAIKNYGIISNSPQMEISPAKSPFSLFKVIIASRELLTK